MYGNHVRLPFRILFVRRRVPTDPSLVNATRRHAPTRCVVNMRRYDVTLRCNPLVGTTHVDCKWKSITPPPTGERSIAMSVSVCLCVCLSAIISSELHVRSSPTFFMYVTYVTVAWSVLFGRRNNKLCTFSFMDDVTHNCS